MEATKAYILQLTKDTLAPSVEERESSVGTKSRNDYMEEIQAFRNELDS